MELLISTLVTLIIVMDPIGTAPIFMALTPGMDDRQRRRIALKAVCLASAILLVFFFVGDTLLTRIGIGIPAFRIAAGVLLFLLAIDMVFARQSGLRSTTRQEQAEAEKKPDVSVFPLAFPIIAGPGALTTVLLLAAQVQQVWTTLTILFILCVVLGLIFVSLWFAGPIMRLLGETGANVISRLLGLLLAALAVQYILDGWFAAGMGGSV